MSAEPTHFFDLDAAGLDRWVEAHGMPRFRARQLRQWVYERAVIDPAAMTDLSKADRARLAERMVFTRGRPVRHQRATDGTQKLLIEWAPGRQTECVMIPAESRGSGRSRRTACISSQVGCPVGCRFCASGLGGLDANLTAGQIVEQVWWLNHLLAGGLTSDEPGAAPPVRRDQPHAAVSHIVFMGMGEPLANFAAVVPAIRQLNAADAFGISGRRITLSTVGLPAQIRRLADQLDVPITLAISLHAPEDALRRQLIPWAESTSLEAIVEAGQYYFQRTGREVTLEYILLRRVNDRPEHARRLARLAGRLRCNVNLIRYNEVTGLPYSRPDREDVLTFQHILQQAGINTHIRASRGRDIAAACGQLRRETARRPAGSSPAPSY